ncbi:MAG: PQQ-dependent sugar dehydrogenase, partial [Candidatus Methylomirabilales bacterium]
MPKINQSVVGKPVQVKLVLGLAVLLLGTLVYVLDRPPERAFVPNAFSLFENTPFVFGRLGQSLPTFAHVFAFSLLTAVLLGGGKRKTIAICLGWMATEAAFELGQHPALAHGLVALIPSWFEQVLILEKTDSYFLRGTFDPADIVTIALGALAAYVVIQKAPKNVGLRPTIRYVTLLSLVSVAILSILATNGGGGDGSMPPSTSPPVTDVTLSLTQFATGLNGPVGVYNAGPGDDGLFVIEQAGVIRIVQSNGAVLATPFLDISARVTSVGEEGLLGLAFHPSYATNGFFYVNYTSTGTRRTRISRFSVTSDPNVADPNSEVILFTVDQPFSNHNAGDIHFGPDGFLYIPLGDGGSGGDPSNNAQNMGLLLGKITRIDVDSGPGVSPDCVGVDGSGQYTIPPTNPFLDGAGGVCDEIWAVGLRNPFRSSFDRLTGDFYIADVGQNAWEEIDFQPVGSTGGENYGWRCFEGFDPFNISGCGSSSSFTFPIFAYPHTGGDCSVIGGYVYRGNLFPALFGHYVLTDFCTGNFWDIIPDGVGGWQITKHTNLTAFGYVSFGEDSNGELYVVHQGSGTLFRLEGM